MMTSIIESNKTLYITTWQNSCQLCGLSTTACYLAVSSAEQGVQPLGSCLEGKYTWFWLNREAYDGSVHCPTVVLEVDVSPQQLPYQYSDVSVLLQISWQRREALQRIIQHPQQWEITSIGQECVHLLTNSVYLDSSRSRKALYHLLVGNVFSTLWTEHNKP